MRNSTRYRDSEGRAANSGITPEIRTTESVEIKEDAILCVTVDVSALDSGPYMSFRGISAISKGWFCTNRTSFDNRRTILTTLAIKRRGALSAIIRILYKAGIFLRGGNSTSHRDVELRWDSSPNDLMAIRNRIPARDYFHFARTSHRTILNRRSRFARIISDSAPARRLR